jgi:hypothetical protein
MTETIPLWQLRGYAAVGALFLWGKLAKTGREVYGLTDILERMGLNESVRRALEPVLFVALGAFVAVGLVQPATIPQAIAAGISWTGLFSK